MKLCSRLLMVFGRNFCKKRHIWVAEPYFGEVRGDTRPWLMARWKAHGRLSIHINWTFSLSLTFLESWGTMCTARLFSQWVNLFALKFYLDRVIPHQPFLASENQRHWVTWRWRLHPSVFLTQYWSVTDRQTDERNCRSTYSACIVKMKFINTLTLWQQKETTRSPVNAEKPCEHNVSWNRVKCCTNVRTAFENACNRQMTFKIIQSHCCCCHLVGHIRFPISLPFKYISILHRFRDTNTYLSK